MKSTRTTVTRTYDIYFTGKYCGDHDNPNICPQTYTASFGTRSLCGLYRTDDGRERDLYTEIPIGTFRCKACIAENGGGDPDV